MSGIVGDFGSKSGHIGSKPYAFLYRTSNQNVSSGSMTKIEFTHMIDGSAGSVDDGWVVSQSGRYSVTLVVDTHSSSNNMSAHYCHVKLGGTTKFGGYSHSNTSARHEQALVHGILSAEAGQYVFGYCEITGTSPMIYVDAGSTYGHQSTCMVIQFLGK